MINTLLYNPPLLIALALSAPAILFLVIGVLIGRRLKKISDNDYKDLNHKVTTMRRIVRKKDDKIYEHEKDIACLVGFRELYNVEKKKVQELRQKIKHASKLLI